MNRCPLTYESCASLKYSAKGLKRLGRSIAALADLPFSAGELEQQVLLRAGKMSIQGVQPKLSAVLSAKHGLFELVDRYGHYILKIQTRYPHLPENEDLTMRLAATVGIEVPLHGLIYAQDQSLVYFIKRFDRHGKAGKIPVEDFAQLAGRTRETKYDFSMEGLVDIVDRYCTFPVLEKVELFRRTIFNFVIGNEDMHLKNFSLITRNDVVGLSPAYDLVNTSLVLREPEEIALPINGKKRGLTKKVLLGYYGVDRLGLTHSVVNDIVANITTLSPQWDSWIERSFLPNPMKESYRSLIKSRLARLR